MWITEHVAGACELLARWTGVLDLQPDRVPERASRPRAPQQTATTPPVAILGVPFEPLTFNSALHRIEEMIQSGQPNYLATANVDFLVQARHDVELRRILRQASLVLCDGTPILWLSRLFGNPLPERVAGSDLTPLLIERAAEKGYRVFFLGGQAEVAAAAVQRLQQRYPSLIVAGHYSPPFKPLLEMDHDDICRRIRDAKPDIVFVSFGCPKAEKWMAMNYKKVGVPVMIGVGATIDFLAGRVKRAPQWMRHTGTEWLYRLSQEPRRLFRRYARDFTELGAGVLGQWWHCRGPLASSPAPAASCRLREDDHLRLQLPERFDKRVVLRDADVWERISGNSCLLMMDTVKCLDSTAMALLLRLHYRLKAEGHHLVIVAPSRRVAAALRWMGLDTELLIAKDTAQAAELLATAQGEITEPVVESAIDWTLPLTWRGEVTGANAELVWQRTHEYLSMCSTRRKCTSIDMSNVRFLDSYGLEVIVRSRDYARQLGLELSFTGLRPALRKLIRVAGLEKRFVYSPLPTRPASPIPAPGVPAPA